MTWISGGSSVGHPEYKINLDHIRGLRFGQTWYWDERRHRLSICLDAVAPLLDVYDSMGNFRYLRPLFYRKALK